MDKLNDNSLVESNTDTPAAAAVDAIAQERASLNQTPPAAAAVDAITQERASLNQAAPATPLLETAPEPTLKPSTEAISPEQATANMSAAIHADIEDMQERELMVDETFTYASKSMFKTLNGEDFTGTPEEAASYGIDLMRKVENNMYNLGDFAYQTEKMSTEEAQTALYMMDMFEAKDFTARGFTEALGYMGLDPTTYLGLGTFGWAFAGRAAVKATAKKTMRAMLHKAAFSSTSVAAVEGAAYGAAFEHGKQVISENGGQGYDKTAVQFNAAMGGLVSGASAKYFPELFDYAKEKVAKWADMPHFKTAAMEAAAAGDKDAIEVIKDLELLENYYKKNSPQGLGAEIAPNELGTENLGALK